MQSWLEGRNTWERFIRSELKLESEHQESPWSDIFRKRATKPLLKQKHRQKHLTWAKEKKNGIVAQWSKVLFSNESKFCIAFGNQGPRVWRKRGEAQNPCCLKSSVKFPQSVMVWGAMSSAGVGPLCFLRSTVNAAIYQDILEHFMLPSADKIYGDFKEMLISFSSRTWHLPTLPKVPKVGLMTWFIHCSLVHLCYCAWLASKLAWPEPKENIWGIVKRKMRDTRPNNADDLKVTIKATWALITPEQCHRLIDSMPRRIDAVIHAKGGPTKFWVHRN